MAQEFWLVKKLGLPLGRICCIGYQRIRALFL